MKIKRFAAIFLVMILLLTGIPVSANAAGTDGRTVVGFEINNPDEIPPLVYNPYAHDLGYSRYAHHNALSCFEFLVTYSDGTTEIAYADQWIGDDRIAASATLDGPGGAVNQFTFTLGEFEVTYDIEFIDSPVASLEVLSEPVLVLGEDNCALVLGSMKGIDLGKCSSTDFEGLVFRINYTNGTSKVVDFADLTWPDHVVYDEFYQYPKYNNYNVEVQAYIPGYNAENEFTYWSGSYYPENFGHEGFTMIMHYMGKIVQFNLEIQEGPKAAIVVQPADVSANVSRTAVFEIGATGPDLAYQWQYLAPGSHVDAWKDYVSEEEQTWYLNITATSELDGYQFRCVVTDSNGVVDYSDPATLTVTYPAKIVNDYYYALSDLTLGSDGVYRTPNGFTVYIAVNNVGDGGLSYLGGYTLLDYVAAYGEEYFDITYWDELVALMDSDGYVPLTQQTLQYLIVTITGNSNWGEDESYIPYYLAYDYDAEPPVQSDGWAEEDGVWYYYQDGLKVTGWLKDGNYWYYMDSTGAMTTGWVQVNGNWYYMNKSGVMQTGWQKINGYWYYMSSGGVMQTGWVSVGGKWYYMNQNGVMQTGWVSVGGKWYYMASGGAMQTGWITVNGSHYYLDSKGVMQTGWQQLNGSWYYFSKGGVMQTGWVYDGGYWYYMNSEGVMQKGWVGVNGKWYYMNKSGVMQTGWVQDGGYWYYMDSKGVMVTGTQVIGGKTYIFNDHGVWIG